MRTFSAVALGLVLAVSILLLWVPARWPVALLQVSVFSLGIAWAMRQLWLPRPVRTSIVLLPLGGAVILGLFQVLSGHTVYQWETWNAILVWTTDLVVFFLSLQVFAEPRIADRFLRAAVVFGCLLAIISVLQLYTANGLVFWLFDSGYRDMVMGPFVYKNQYAAFIELLLPLALVGALTDRLHAMFYAVAAATMYASVIAAASRAGFVLASAELLVVPLLVLRRKALDRRRAVMLVAMVLGLTAIFTWAVGWDVLWDRLHKPDPYEIRREFLQSSLEMVRVHPIIGFGLGTWSTAYPAYAYFDNGRFANQAHNDWAQWACEGGLILAALMLWIAIWTLRAGLRAIWSVGICAVFLHCWVDYPIQRPGLGTFFFMFLGLLAGCRELKK